MNTLTINQCDQKRKSAVIGQYDTTSDAKNRISLRGSKSKYFHVKAFSNGCYILEPRLLIKPTDISDRTLKMLEQSVSHFKRGMASPPIDLSAFI